MKQDFTSNSTNRWIKLKLKIHGEDWKRLLIQLSREGWWTSNYLHDSWKGWRMKRNDEKSGRWWFTRENGERWKEGWLRIGFPRRKYFLAVQNFNMICNRFFFFFFLHPAFHSFLPSFSLLCVLYNSSQEFFLLLISSLYMFSKNFWAVIWKGRNCYWEGRICNWCGYWLLLEQQKQQQHESTETDSQMNDL